MLNWCSMNAIGFVAVEDDVAVVELVELDEDLTAASNSSAICKELNL